MKYPETFVYKVFIAGEFVGAHYAFNSSHTGCTPQEVVDMWNQVYKNQQVVDCPEISFELFTNAGV